jgi:hypothetical protein
LVIDLCGQRHWSQLDLNQNAVGGLNQSYVSLCGTRLAHDNAPGQARQIAVQDEASHIPEYITRDTVSLIWTSPPYANLLNRKRKNKSRRGDERKNKQFGQVEQYSQDPRDLGTMPLDDYTRAMGDIFQRLLPLLRPKAHCVINVPDMWWENQRITLHVALVEAARGYGCGTLSSGIAPMSNWVGIFGWPSITSPRAQRTSTSTLASTAVLIIIPISIGCRSARVGRATAPGSPPREKHRQPPHPETSRQLCYGMIIIYRPRSVRRSSCSPRIMAKHASWRAALTSSWKSSRAIVRRSGHSWT